MLPEVTLLQGPARMSSRSVFQATKQVARRELLQASQVPDLEHLDNMSEVCVGVLVTLLGAAVLMGSLSLFEAVFVHPPTLEGPPSAAHFKSALGDRSLNLAFQPCRNEYGELHAGLRCWLSVASPFFASRQQAAEAFLRLDCDRDLFVSDQEVSAVLQAGEFICDELQSKPSPVASAKTVDADDAIRAAPNGSGLGLRWDSSTTGISASAATTIVSASEHVVADVAVSTTANLESTPELAVLDIVSTSNLEARDAAEGSTRTAITGTASASPTAQPHRLGPMSLEEYRSLLGNERERAAIEIVLSGISSAELGTDHWLGLKTAFASIVANEVGGSPHDVLDQSGAEGVASLAGFPERNQIIGACSVALPRGVRLAEVKRIAAAQGVRQEIATSASTALGEPVSAGDVAIWAERGQDLATRLDPLFPDAVSMSSFVAFAAPRTRLSEAQVEELFQVLDRNQDGRLSGAELFV